MNCTKETDQDDTSLPITEILKQQIEADTQAQQIADLKRQILKLPEAMQAASNSLEALLAAIESIVLEAEKLTPSCVLEALKPGSKGAGAATGDKNEQEDRFDYR